ncbi:hypothetical protein [Deinococcus koreensis]|uniref:Uncharacterized protein n=1 Tax=Deinococcus koreensis TaxID=2054903 RepID=A0A2K3UVV7_9DEIO|nr:hypothetical protein [Deinococcus koreensis]PNY80679.1 hypothetical protein CVO96_04255 [Deinococcus koreensis]
MGQEKPQTTEQGTGVSTPETMDTHGGGDASTHGVNTNLDPNMQGGPATPADRAATEEIERQHVQDTGPE